MFPLPISIPMIYTTIIGVGGMAILLVYLENKRKIKINKTGFIVAILAMVLYLAVKYVLPSFQFFF